MKRMLKTILILMIVSCFAVALTGCGEEGAGEKAGKEIDNTIDSAKKKLNEMTK